MGDTVETPKERVARFTKLAEQAEELAKKAKSSEMRSGFEALARGWRSLAREAVKRG